MKPYPENRLNIRVDEQGRVTFEQDPAFAEIYNRRPAGPMAEKLETLREKLEDLIIDEPVELYSDAHDDWEMRRAELEDEIEDLEREIGD